MNESFMEWTKEGWVPTGPLWLEDDSPYYEIVDQIDAETKFNIGAMEQLDEYLSINKSECKECDHFLEAHRKLFGKEEYECSACRTEFRNPACKETK